MMRKKLVVACIAVGVLCVFGTTGWAEDLKIGFVDLQKLVSKSSRAQAQQAKLSKWVEDKQKGLENKRKELQDLQDQLQKQGPMLKEETRNAKIKELGLKEMEYKMAEKEAQSQLQNEQRDLDEVFKKDLVNIVKEIRAQKKLSLVLNSMALFAADDTMDVTDEVIKLYDAGAASAGPAKPKPAPTKPAPGPAKR
jgi:outer membrane protein